MQPGDSQIPDGPGLYCAQRDFHRRLRHGHDAGVEWRLCADNPAAYTHLSVLSTAGNGPARIVYYVNYADGSQDANFFDSADWFTQNGNGNNYAFTNTAWVCNGDFAGNGGRIRTDRLQPAAGQALLY